MRVYRVSLERSVSSPACTSNAPGGQRGTPNALTLAAWGAQACIGRCKQEAKARPGCRAALVLHVGQGAGQCVTGSHLFGQGLKL